MLNRASDCQLSVGECDECNEIKISFNFLSCCNFANLLPVSPILLRKKDSVLGRLFY